MNESRLFKNTALALNMAWILIFVVVPGFFVVAVGFFQRDSGFFFRAVPTLSNYRLLFDPINARILLKTLYYALGTTVICLAAGYPFAWIISRAKGRLKTLLLIMVIIPFWTSSLVRTYALVILLKANGIINYGLMAAGFVQEPVSMLYTEFAVLTGLVYSLLPFMILPLYAVLEKLDTRLLEAAKDLGAKGPGLFFKIVLPLSLPGIMAGCIMVFLPAMGLFYVPDLLGGSKSMLVGNFIKNQFLVSGNWPMGSAASTCLMLIMALMMAAYFLILKKLNRSMMP